MLIRYLLMIVDFVFFRYSRQLTYLMVAVIGIILSKKYGKADSVRIGGACVLLAAAFAAEYFLPLLMSKSMNQTVYFIVLFGSYIIRYAAMIIAFKIFCGYKLTKMVGFLFIIAIVVCFFYCLFRVRVIFGIGSFVNGIDKGTSFLMAFFNNEKALNFVSILLSLVPPISLCIDGFLTIKKD